MSSSSDPVVALRDAWRQARDALSFSSVRGREVTATHLLRIGRATPPSTRRCREASACGPARSAPAATGGGSSFYYPNGHATSKSGGAFVSLRLQDNRFLGTADDATAAYRVAILDGDGEEAYSTAVSPREYSHARGGASGFWVDVGEDKADMLRRCLEDDGLSVRCDVTVLSVVRESRVKCFLRDWFQQ